MNKRNKPVEVKCPAHISRKCVGSRMFKVNRDDLDDYTYQPVKQKDFMADLKQVVPNILNTIRRLFGR